MATMFRNILGNDKVFLLIVIGIFILNYVFHGLNYKSSILATLFLVLFCIKVIRNTVIKANTIPKQTLWLLIAPWFTPLVPLLILESFFGEKAIYIPIYLVSFVATWFVIIFRFELYKVKVAVNFINALVLTISSMTFIIYFYTGNIEKLMSPDLLSLIRDKGWSTGTTIALIIQVLTLPYVLSCIWSNVALAIIEYKQNTLLKMSEKIDKAKIS